MAIDEKLSAHVRAALQGAPSITEVKMFGGLGFMLHGNMVAAVSAERGLLLRVGEASTPEALARGANPMVMKGRAMKGYVRVQGELDEASVASWVRLARAFVETMPPKTAAAPATKSRRAPAPRSSRRAS